MELRFAHLADYATADASGKVTIVGIFDIVWDQSGVTPILFPPCYLAASFAASASEGSSHRLEIRFLDADDQPFMPSISADVVFQASGPGNPLRAQLLLGFGPKAIRVPQVGDYVIRFLLDGTNTGEIPVTVRTPPPEV
jgi:hypothetical protein